MKKLVLILSLITSTLGCVMQQAPTLQPSSLQLVNITYKQNWQAEEIQNDINALFAGKVERMRNYMYSMEILVYIDASEKEIRKKFKNKKWSSQIKSITGDRVFSVD